MKTAFGIVVAALALAAPGSAQAQRYYVRSNVAPPVAKTAPAQPKNLTCSSLRQGTGTTTRVSSW